MPSDRFNLCITVSQYRSYLSSLVCLINKTKGGERYIFFSSLTLISINRNGWEVTDGDKLSCYRQAGDFVETGNRCHVKKRCVELVEGEEAYFKHPPVMRFV